MSLKPKNLRGRATPWRQGVRLFGAAVALCVWALIAIIIWAQRETALAQAEANASNLSAAFEEQIRLVMNGVTGAMNLIDHRIGAEGDAFDLREWAAQIPEIAASTVQVVIIGADGKLVATTLDAHPEPMDLSDREHFRVHVEDPSHGVFIGKPVLGRVSGQVTIQVTKRLEHADGSFAGVLLFSLSPEYLTTLYRKVDLGRTGVMTLAGTDGIIRARFTATGTVAPGASLEGTELLAASRSASEGSDENPSRFDHVTRIFHWRRVEGFPLIAIVGLGKAEALEPINRHALDLAGIAVIMTLVLAVFTETLRREVDRRAQQEIALAEEGERLRRSQNHLARAQRVSSTGSDERDLTTDRAEWSDEVYRVMGVAPETFEPTTANFLNLVHPDDRHIVTATRAEIARGVCPAPFEYRIVRTDGTIRWIYREVELIRDAAGKPLSMLGTVKDITELHAARERQAELERELLHSQKLEALGTLAGGIAHDLNNALVPILALTQQIARRTHFGSRDRANLDMVAAAARRARDLVKQILAFSRKEAAERQELDLATLAHEALEMLRVTLPSTIQIATEIAAPAPVFGDPGQLHQVVVNLMTNAAQAIGGELGRISLSLSISSADQLSPNDAIAGAAVRLSITDTGCGMDAETRGRIFDPFFTTKSVGEGTGLGLSVVHGIVESHGGRIEVESSPGRGTTFVVVLPLYRGENARQPFKAASASHAYAATEGGSSAG